MANRQSTPGKAIIKQFSRSRPEMLVASTGQTLHMWHGIPALPRVKAIWRSEIGKATCQQANDTP